MTRIVVCHVLVLALAGCGGAGSPPDREPEYAGVLDARDREGRFLVRAEGDGCGIWLTPEERADVYRRNAAGELAEIGWDELRRGDDVEVWISGGIAESCPAQAAAEAAVVRG